jgi:phage FluMu protein Com
MDDTESVTCTDCETALPNSHIREHASEPCPNCGSRKKHIHLTFNEEAGLTIHESLKGKVKNPSLPSKNKTRKEFFSGDDLRRRDGKWMQKERIIDKDNDHYFEKVVDPETGEVVHHTSEPLSQHVDHGTAKLKGKAD